MRDGKKIDSTNCDVLPGEQINLSIKCDNQDPISDIKWTIDVKTFKDYTITATDTESIGELTLLDEKKGDLTKDTVTFYWADTGNSKSISVKFKHNNKDCTLSTVLNVKNPLCTFSATIGTTKLLPATSSTRVGLMPNANQAHGIDFTCTVEVPTGFQQGEWNFTQLITSTRIQIKDGGGNYVQQFVPPATPVLDTKFPYAGPFPTSGTAEPTFDGPYVLLSGKYQVKTLTGFKMYILFKPIGTNSRWVPLKFIAWSLTYCAQRAGVNDPWQISGPNQSLGNVTDTTDHPVWKKKITHYLFDPTEPFPACTPP